MAHQALRIQGEPELDMSFSRDFPSTNACETLRTITRTGLHHFDVSERDQAGDNKGSGDAAVDEPPEPQKEPGTHPASTQILESCSLTITTFKG